MGIGRSRIVGLPTKRTTSQNTIAYNFFVNNLNSTKFSKDTEYHGS